MLLESNCQKQRKEERREVNLIRYKFGRAEDPRVQLDGLLLLA